MRLQVSITECRVWPWLLKQSSSRPFAWPSHITRFNVTLWRSFLWKKDVRTTCHQSDTDRQSLTTATTTTIISSISSRTTNCQLLDISWRHATLPAVNQKFTFFSSLTYICFFLSTFLHRTDNELGELNSNDCRRPTSSVLLIRQRSRGCVLCAPCRILIYLLTNLWLVRSMFMKPWNEIERTWVADWET